MEQLTTSLATGITDLCSSALSSVGAIAPKALPIFGAMVVIGLVMKTIKKFT